ncbi:VCBS repeat-containing protein [Aquimarina sp. 2201CG5-10]|uniref:VCBS repeat-containing protein n=1 Tax=Aquimarina callyspongiae TaxID=3098150 RepID=UPI002AB39DD4|nr:VCBS repeat-containing protein [Aquimarina sp. 2201CG5-10]MDY8137963.1 VCBS repeat-containing protein [Aquimarina sp. 2201CG5-10]
MSIKNFLFFALIVVIGCKSRDLEKPVDLFTLLTPEETNVTFSNILTEGVELNSMEYEYFYNGGGVAIGDINNDGLQDIYFTANIYKNKLYLNKGNLEFEDITEKAGVLGSAGWTTGVTMADVNNDGFLDIYISKSGKFGAKKRANELYINNGNLTFTESAGKYGLDTSSYTTQSIFFDYDKDGDLDMYQLNHSIRLEEADGDHTLKKQYDALVGDKLFENDNGFFRETKNMGIASNPISCGLGVVTSDLNGDGWQDIYVSNDFLEHDYMYINLGEINGVHQGFENQIKTNTQHISHFSMGLDIADFNNDRKKDILTVDMVSEDNYGIKTSMSGMSVAKFVKSLKNGFHRQYMFNSLQINNGTIANKPFFSEIAHLANISNTDWSWAPLFVDFDNDGLLDVFVANGLKRDFMNNDYNRFKKERVKTAYDNKEDYKSLVLELVDKTPNRASTNYFYKNNGDLTFSNIEKEWGFSKPSYSNGAAYADLDNDGDMDMVVNNVDEPAYIYRNNAQQILTNNYLKITLKGGDKNTYGIGTNITIWTNEKTMTREQQLTRGYQSSVSEVIHFGVGEFDVIDSLLVEWPDGKIQLQHKIKANQEITLEYSKAYNKEAKTKITTPLFKDYTRESEIDHEHNENIYNDFDRESLLPHKMSEFGPALAVADVNNDGLEDFYVGGALGYSGSLYIQSIKGTFSKSASQNSWEKDKAYEDVDAEFIDVDNDGDKDLYIVSGGNEYSNGDLLQQDRLYLNNGKGIFTTSKNILPKISISGSVVKAADYNNDGYIDLFVGGRQVPGQYPTAPKSYVLENKGGYYETISNDLIPELEQIGMVTDAVWSDYNQDGYVDLILVGEWMSIQIFKNLKNGGFERLTNEEFQNNTGWWYSIIAADFDNDGDQDFIAGNLGLNYKYKASKEEPFNIYANDFDKNGSLDIVLGYHNQGELYPLRGRECTSNQMPFIKEKFPDYDSFGKASLIDVYGKEALSKSIHYSATNFSSVYIENKGNENFKMHDLPLEAQFSSINSMVVDDFDNDKNLDILIAGNLYQSEVETPRNDASYGLVLLGDGKGDFIPLDYQKSGVYVKGDVKNIRAISVGSKKNILLGRNNAKLKLIQAVKDKKVDIP